MKQRRQLYNAVSQRRLIVPAKRLALHNPSAHTLPGLDESYMAIPEYLVEDSSGHYLLIGTAERDDTGEAILIRSVLTENGVSAVHTLNMHRSALPAPLGEWVAKEFP